MRTGYALGILFLSATSLLFALGIIFGEATSRWSFGGALVGGLLLAYSFVVLLLRKMGMIGPRKAEK